MSLAFPAAYWLQPLPPLMTRATPLSALMLCLAACPAPREVPLPPDPPRQELPPVPSNQLAPRPVSRAQVASSPPLDPLDEVVRGVFALDGVEPSLTSRDLRALDALIEGRMVVQ